MKLGVDKCNKVYTGFGKVWGWGDNIIVMNTMNTLNTFNYNFCRFVGNVIRYDEDPLIPGKKLDFFGKYMIRAYWYESE